MIQVQKNFNSFPNQFLDQIKDSEPKYKKISQIALYASLQMIEQLAIFTKSSCDVQCNVVFCYHAQKFDQQRKNQITYYIIRTLNEQIPKLKNKYSLAYVHDTLSGFLYFRNIIRLLPAEFLARLKDFYIIHAGIAVRIIQLLSFGQINNYIKSKTRHLQRVDQIETLNKITLGGDVVMKSKMKQARESEAQRNTISHTKQMQSSDVNIIRNNLYGKQISEYPLSSHGIPILIQILLSRLYSNIEFLQAEGIMRKSCDVQQLQILEQHIIQDPNWPLYVMKCDDPYVICGCVKKIFNNLNTPLFSYEIYDMIISYRSDGHAHNDIMFMRSCLTKMNKTNRIVLLYTIAFLKKGIVKNQQHNKMSPYNLAVVFGPCFFRPKQYRLQDLMSSGRFSFMIKMLLQSFEDIATQQTANSMYNLLQIHKKQYRMY